MGKYDTTIRTILNEGCSTFMDELGIHHDAKPLPIKIPRVSAREVDYVGRDARTGIVYHIEFQVGNDTLMSVRMLIYAGQIGERVMQDEMARARVKQKRLKEPPVSPDIRSTLVYVAATAWPCPTE
ncbi:MAG: hypothetical protein PGN25_04200 [Methylorubrum populi]